MSTSYANQLQTISRLLQSKCNPVWSQIGVEGSEQAERLREFEAQLIQMLNDYEQDQHNESSNLQNQIKEYLNDINEQRHRMGIEAQLPKLSGTFRQQREQCLAIRAEVTARVEEQEKIVCMVVTNLKRLYCLLGLEQPTYYDNNTNYDLSHAAIEQLKQEERELVCQVDKNRSLVQSTLPFLVYYMKEMNLFEETSRLHSTPEHWMAEGNELNRNEALVGRDVYELLEKSKEFKHTTLEMIIGQNVNFADIPYASKIPSTTQNQHTRRQSLISSSSLSIPDSSHIFEYYPIEFSSFPVDQEFVTELGHKKTILEQMYKERCEYTQEIGHKILALWELTEMSPEARAAWMESCTDLSMMTLRRFQFELLRLMQQKSQLLPQWIGKYENMIHEIGARLGLTNDDTEHIINQCQQTLTQDDQLHALRTEYTHLDTRLQVCQPILDKIALYTRACSEIHTLKELELHPNRYKDAKIRSTLDQLRKTCKDLPKKAATLYTEITKFESTFGPLLNCGQRALSALEQDEYYIQAVKQGYIRQPRQSANALPAVSGTPHNATLARAFSPATASTLATSKSAATKLNTTTLASKTVPTPAKMGSKLAPASSSGPKPLSQASSVMANRTLTNISGTARTATSSRAIPSTGVHGAAKPTMTARRSSRELNKRNPVGGRD